MQLHAWRGACRSSSLPAPSPCWTMGPQTLPAGLRLAGPSNSMPAFWLQPNKQADVGCGWLQCSIQHCDKRGSRLQIARSVQGQANFQ